MMSSRLDKDKHDDVVTHDTKHSTKKNSVIEQQNSVIKANTS